MNRISKISNSPEWLSKLAQQFGDPHEDGYLDEIVNHLSEESLREFLQKLLVEIDDNTLAFKILKEMGKADKDNKSFEKKGEEKEYNINPDKALIRNHDETPGDSPINY
jgi:hypothetical protein